MIATSASQQNGITLQIRNALFDFAFTKHWTVRAIVLSKGTEYVETHDRRPGMGSFYNFYFVVDPGRLSPTGPVKIGVSIQTWDRLNIGDPIIVEYREGRFTFKRQWRQHVVKKRWR